MIRLAEAVVFLGIAGALHLAALGMSQGDAGGASGGDEGAASVTLQAAPEHLAALARQWEQPPETATVAERATPAPPDSAPAMSPTADPAPQAPRSEAPASPTRDTAPSADTRLPAPRSIASGPPTAPATPGLPAPTLPQSEGQSDTAPQRQAPALAMQLPQPDAPLADTAAAAPRHAPTASLRPEPRPEKPAPRAATPRPAPAQPSAPAPAQRAQGSGTAPPAAAPARRSPAPAPGPSAATLRQAQAQWGGQIRQSVARAQRYPGGTRARGIVTLQISVAPSGSLRGVSVTGSSGDAALDRAAVSAARNARLPRAPNVLTKASYSFNLPLQFARR